MLFLHEVKADEVGEYRILNVFFEKYFKEVGLEPDAINKWFAKYPYPLCMRFSTKDGVWNDELIHSKEEYYYFLDRVISHRSEGLWFSWHESSLLERHRYKLRKCTDIEAMERDRKSFVSDLMYCTLCIIRDMDLYITLPEEGTLKYHLKWKKRDDPSKWRTVEKGTIKFEIR